jgi:hypothetical protein
MKNAKSFKGHRGTMLLLGAFTSWISPFWTAPLYGEDNPPARVARVSYLKGDVSFLRAGVEQWSAAALNFPVTTGDRIYTDKNASAELEVGSYAVRLASSTDLTVTNLNDQIMQLGLEQGTLRVSVYELPSGNTVEVDTPNGALTVQGQGTYRIDTDADGGRSVVSVNSGSLEITGPGVSQTLQAGQAVKLSGHDPIEATSIPMPGLDSFDKWSEGRDKRLGSSASAKYVSRGIPGYADLDDYGHWEEVAEYGPIWYPPVIAAEWVPYRFGHWVWIEPWGWTWVEDEPWGFCPFHYGRWVHIGVAWGWLPGPYVVRPVYAPALVAFVGGSHFSVSVRVGGVGLAAWFPLGPGEPYFPWYHYRADYLREVNVTNIRNVTNITNITNINNINEVHYAYRTVGTTAVPADVFNSGQAVARQAVRVSPQQLEKAQVIPHPTVNPTARAALPGRPVVAPQIHAASLLSARRVTSATSGTYRSAIGETRQPAPLVTRNSSPTGNAGRALPSDSNAKTQPAATGAASASVRQNPPRLITRSAPPPPKVPFVEQRRSMYEHPGRPLEPQQLENLRAGRPVGPMQDREFPPHAVPIPRTRSAPAPQAARPRRP